MRNYSLLVLALFALRLSAAAAALPFPQDGSDIAPDPAAHFGALPNGMRYVIVTNHEPRDRVALRLLVLSGSLEEKDNQRGLAHYLEHMAFNGSTNYPPDSLIKYFQRMGMNLGGDTNAHTGFDRTIYQINLPHSDDATVAEGLKVFSDFSGGLLLTPAMVDKERPIILSEKRTSDSALYRESMALFKFNLADSLFARRLVIGEKSDIDQATREQFLDIYNTWYRPERMAVVVVGEVDPAKVVTQITEAFGSLTPRAPARSDPDLGHVTTALGIKPFYHYEPESPITIVRLEVLTPFTYQPDNSVIRRNHVYRSLALSMLNRRLATLANTEKAPFLTAGAQVSEQFNFFRDSAITLQCAPEQWQGALAAGEQELRRALQYGFTTAELREAVADDRNSHKRSAESAATRRSDELAERVANLLADKLILTSPADDYARVGKVLDEVKPEDCLAALRFAFATPGRYVTVMGNVKIAGDPDATITSAHNTSVAVAVKPPAEKVDAAFAYTDFGPAGKIVSRKRVEDLDITQIVFSNGVRLNLKKTDFEANRLRVLVRIGGGVLTLPRDQPGLQLFADTVFNAGGLGKHSTDDLRRIFAGKTIGANFSVGPDAFLFASGVTTRDNLLLQLQLFAAGVTDPGYRPEAGRLASKYFNAIYIQIEKTPTGPLNTVIPTLLADGDTRFGLPPKSVELSRTLAEERAWLTPQFASGPIEISVVGDLDLEASIDFVAQTFGALPSRQPKPAYTEERKVHFPAEVFNKKLEIPTAIPKGLVADFWPTTDSRDVNRSRRLQMLCAVFADKLRIKLREQLGDAYGVAAQNDQGFTYTGYGSIRVMTIVAPDRADAVEKAILTVAADLQTNGVTADELERAKKPAITGIKDSTRTNPYWLRQVLADCQENPEHLDWARTRESGVQAITADELSALAKTYLSPDRAFKVQAVPAAAAPKVDQ